MRSESRRNGLTCCGWCAARHASINPSYLTEGYKSTDNNQTTGQNPTVHKGFSPYPACVNKALKVDIRFFRQEGFSLNEETWVRDIKEKREIYGISQQKLALAAGITRPYLSDIETGKAHPSEALQEAITEALERFNPDNPLEMLFDYVRIRFPTTDVKHIVEDVLRLKLPYFIPIADAEVKNRFEIRLKNERAFYAIRDLLEHDNPERTAFQIINRYVRFVDRDDTKPRSDWRISEEWAWFIGEHRGSLKLTTKPEPYSFERTLHWLSHQVAPTLKLALRLDKMNHTQIVHDIITHARLTEKHEKILKQQAAAAKEVVL